MSDPLADLTPEQRHAILADLLHQITSGRQRGVLAELDALAVKEWEHPSPVCPRCGYRPSRHRRTGWCHVCHLRELTEQAALASLEIEERRRYDVERQRLSRLRRSSAEPPVSCDTDSTLEAGTATRRTGGTAHER